MSFLDKLHKFARFYSEGKILARIPKKTTYTENTVNGQLVNQDILIDDESVKHSLTAKEEYIKAATQKETKKREKAKDLPEHKVRQIREQEEKARFAAHRHIRNLEGR